MIQSAIFRKNPASSVQRIRSAPPTTDATSSATSNASTSRNRPPIDVGSVDTLFDSSIEDDDLVALVEHVSQSFACESHATGNDRSGSSHSNEVVGNGTYRGDAGGDINNSKRPRLDIKNVAHSNSLSQLTSNSSNSTLNAMLARSVEGFRFERIDTCNINFYLSK